ncbi:hypothetical protein GCM10028815_33170 [Mariniluteicoccus flavus]
MTPKGGVHPQVVAAAHGRVDGERVEHGADGAGGGGELGVRHAVHQGRAAVGAHQAQEDLQGRALAGAVGAEEAGHAPWQRAQRHPGEDRRAGESFVEVADLDAGGQGFLRELDCSYN